MSNLSNNTKASLFFDDITSGIILTKDKSRTVQSFHYRCERKRNAMGMPYGPTAKTYLRFSVKTLPDGHLKDLYNRMYETVPSAFSFVFNATFDPDDQLSDYDTALVVEGFITSVDEVYEGLSTETTDAKGLMLTNVEFLAKSISYMGSGNKKKSLNIHF